MLGKINYSALGGSDWWGGRKGELPPAPPLHACFKAYYFRLITKCVLTA